MSDWPVGLSTGCFYQLSIFDCLELIRCGGFTVIEICSSPAHLNYHEIATVKKASRLLKSLGMEAYSFHAPFIDVDISSPDQGHRDYSLKELLLAAEAAAAMDVRHFVIHPGPDKTLVFSIEERMQRLKNAAEVLNKVAKRCQELRVGLVLENMLPHLPFGSSSDMLWIMGAMESLNICTCLDTGHAALSGDVYSVMYKLSGHLRVIHANDNFCTSDDHLPPGKGMIDWNRVLFELSETNFHGGMILELSGSTGNDIATTLESARQSSLYLRNIARQLYLSSPPSVEVATRQGTDGQPEH
jgi:sugar phosphate isomerase/epimerase